MTFHSIATILYKYYDSPMKRYGANKRAICFQKICFSEDKNLIKSRVKNPRISVGFFVCVCVCHF